MPPLLVRTSFSLLLMTSLGALACSPPPPIHDARAEMQRRYREADYVFLATLVKTYVMPERMHGEGPTEAVDFRIDRIYKGPLMEGQRWATLTTGFGASCGLRVLPGVDASIFSGEPAKAARGPDSRQWLFYVRGYTGTPRITNLTTPVSLMVGNLAMLEEIWRQAGDDKFDQAGPATPGKIRRFAINRTRIEGRKPAAR